MPDLTRVIVYPLNNWGAPIYTFPRGNTDLTTLAASDPNGGARGVLFNRGTRYSLELQFTGGNVQRWQADSKYDAGGTVGVEFEEMELD